MGSKRLEGGFTIVELLIALGIFAMVMAGLAVIYSSAFKQGAGLLTETRLRNMATVSMRAIQKELAQATTIQLPLPGSWGRHLRGYTNMSPDLGTDGFPADMNINSSPSDTHWFHFCIRQNAGPGTGCGEITPPNRVSYFPPECLFYYRGPNSSQKNQKNQWYSLPQVPITDSNCGEPVTAGDGTQVKPELLAAGIQGDLVPGSGNSSAQKRYFTRGTDSDNTIWAGNQVRVSFWMQTPADMLGNRVQYPRIRVEADTTFSMQMPPDGALAVPQSVQSQP